MKLAKIENIFFMSEIFGGLKFDCLFFCEGAVVAL
jgi:hypothetical protein